MFPKKQPFELYRSRESAALESWLFEANYVSKGPSQTRLVDNVGKIICLYLLLARLYAQEVAKMEGKSDRSWKVFESPDWVSQPDTMAFFSESFLSSLSL